MPLRLLPLRLRGLSPLARGNLSSFPPVVTSDGPIPARTGQPNKKTRSTAGYGAYPRSHGATLRRMAYQLAGWGLSPLARGNLRSAIVGCLFLGPIPARTGQPLALPSSSAAVRAYPRSHGATGISLDTKRANLGLSPLARGNHRGFPMARAGLGPIPARTGQPGRPSLTPW